MRAAQPQDRETAHRWYDLNAERVLAELESNADRGLSTDEARLRLTRYGPNVLAEGRRRTPFGILLAQFSDVMVMVLIAAAVVSGFLGEWGDIAAIVIVVVLNAILGFVQEYRAERAVAVLRAMVASSARVRRDAAEFSVPSAGLVTGDIVLVEAGNIVPADLRLVDVNRLRVEEAALTGESQAVEKTSSPMGEAVLALGDRRNMAYKGTTVSYGRGTGVVVATGMRTELGRIAALLRDEEETRGACQREAGQLAQHPAPVERT